MPVILGKCRNCNVFMVVDDVAELTHVKVRVGRRTPVHEHDVLETITVDNPHLVIKHIFQVLDAHKGDIKVKLKGEDFPEIMRSYLEVEGNRKR